MVAHGAQLAGQSAWLGRDGDHSRRERRHGCGRAGISAKTGATRSLLPTRPLAQLREPLNVTVYLAAEDPRLVDLERNILSKLSRTVPRLKVAYAVGSRTGLFERADDHYGEVWYALGDRNVMTHSATEPTSWNFSISWQTSRPGAA
jgi:hypothetical protein